MARRSAKQPNSPKSEALSAEIWIKVYRSAIIEHLDRMETAYKSYASTIEEVRRDILYCREQIDLLSQGAPLPKYNLVPVTAPSGWSSVSAAKKHRSVSNHSLSSNRKR